MTDIQDLKAIAERCRGHQPLRFMRSHGALYIRNDNGIVFDVHQNRSFPEFMAQNKDYADLVLAANPAAVLELIARIDRLSADNKAKNGSLAAYGKQISALQRAVKNRDKVLAKVSAERDKLKTENERLELENEDTLKKYEEAVEGFTKLSAEVLDLRQQLAVPSDVLADCEAMRLDAERYRWIRSRHNDQSSDIAVESDSRGLLEEIYNVSPDCMDLDAAVDAGISQEPVQ